jgi:hypothetical protein
MGRLRPIRAAAHRTLLGPEFVPADNDLDPQGLSLFQLIADPKFAYLGRQVLDQLRVQFSEREESGSDEAEVDAYRLRLEGWADILEILLDEVLMELAALRTTGGEGLAARPKAT